jgi:histidinol dehydrogenase
MDLITKPAREVWPQLAKRPAVAKQELDHLVIETMAKVRKDGDAALLALTARYDGARLANLAVSEVEIANASGQVNEPLKQSIQLAIDNVKRFHASQINQEKEVVTVDGVSCWRRSVAIEKVGLYIPGGSAPLFSTIIMLAVPAQLAGCSEIVLTTPPDSAGNINPVILYTADLLGINKIFKVGGAQAIAALTYGTESIPAVYKIFGPGNQYVTRAKEFAQQEGVAIDMPAGPSEVLIIADDTANPEFVAADLLSQAEHGTDSQVVLVTDNKAIADECLKEVERQVAELPRKGIAMGSLLNSKAIVMESLGTCLEFSNLYAPEHLIVAVDNAREYVDQITNAGSVFLGHMSCESAGDYASGTNHTLPTNGYARSYSGVSLDSFVKKITFQELNEQGLKAIGPAIELMAAAEGLEAHKNAVTVRLKSIGDE